MIINQRHRATGPREPSSRRDDGSTFIELLISIVLIGLTVVAVLTAVRTNVIATRLERDHSRAQVWLQSASEVLQATPRVGCDPVGSPAAVPDVRGTYESAVRTLVNPPPGWNAVNQLDVTGVLFWNGDTYQTDCRDNAGFRLQLVTIRVYSLDRDILEEVSVVKDTPDAVVSP